MLVGSVNVNLIIFDVVLLIHVFTLFLFCFCLIGNFNIFCDPSQGPPAKPAPRYPTVAAAAKPPIAPLSQSMAAPTPCNPSSTSAFSVHSVGAPPSKSSQQAEQDTITPNQSFATNTSSTIPHGAGLNDDKTPQSSMMSEKTPSSASFASLSRSRNGRLSNIRTPKGLTAPSPTINTKEALGVINAMLNCSLKSNQFDLDGDFQHQVTHQEKDFEMDFANAESNGKPVLPAFRTSTSFINKIYIGLSFMDKLNATCKANVSRAHCDLNSCKSADFTFNMPIFIINYIFCICQILNFYLAFYLIIFCFPF